MSKQIVSPIPKPYGGCRKCKHQKGDCGEHSMDFAWRELVARLQGDRTKLRNERDYWKARYENLKATAGVSSAKEEI